MRKATTNCTCYLQNIRTLQTTQKEQTSAKQQQNTEHNLNKTTKTYEHLRSNLNSRVVKFNSRELFGCLVIARNPPERSFYEHLWKLFLSASRAFVKPPGPRKTQENHSLETKFRKNQAISQTIKLLLKNMKAYKKLPYLLTNTHHKTTDNSQKTTKHQKQH